MSVTIEDIEALKRILSELPRHQPKQVSKQEAIGLLSGELGAARRRGYSPDELAQILSERGVTINAATLRGYLRRNRKSRKSDGSSAAADRGHRPEQTAQPASAEPGTRTPTPVTATPPSLPKPTATSALSPARPPAGNQAGNAPGPRPPAGGLSATNATVPYK